MADPEPRFPPGGPSRPAVSPADVAVGGAVVALGLFFGLGAFSINPGSGYDRIGPRFFPFLVGAMLVVLGLILLRGALRGERAEPAAEEDADPNQPADLRALGLLSLGLVLDILLLDRLGFVLASSVLFWLAARAFKSRRPLRDAAVGVVLSLVAYLVFTRGLGLTLPAGVLGGLL